MRMGLMMTGEVEEALVVIGVVGVVMVVLTQTSSF